MLLTFDWSALANSTGNRASSIRVYTTTDGTTFTELAGAAVLNKSNNVVAAGSITSVQLPSALDNSPTARIRFYEYNGTGGTNGSRARLGIDNVAVTSNPQTNLVTSAADDGGAGTLRSVIASSISGDTITFTNTLSGATITLTNGQLTVAKSLAIDASALANGIQINGNANGRIFLFTGGTTNSLAGLTLTNGYLAGTEYPTKSGGAIFLTNGVSLTIINCTLSGNTANFGGGIINISGTLTIHNSTFSGNNSVNFDGGGIYNAGGIVTVNNTTLSGNTANSSGGGIRNVSGTLNLTNSIVAGNTASSGSNILGTITTSVNSLTSGNPLLAPLGNYGGPTQTMPPLPGSPAIDAGLTSATNSLTDQRGFARVVGSAVDIGAVESGNAIPALTVNTAVDENNGLGVGGISLRDAIAFAPSGSGITFATNLSGSTITLTAGQLLISDKNLTIDASALPGGITISGNHASRVFEIADGTTNTLIALTISSGTDLFGGGVFNSGVLMVDQCTIANNAAASYGGGIYNASSGVLTVNRSTISQNTSGNIDYGGGGISNDGTVTVSQSTITGNTTARTGGGIDNFGTLTVLQSTIISNLATLGGGGIYIAAGTALLTNNIVARNTGSPANIFGTFSGANNFTSTNPQLAPLGHYGGPTQTMPPLPGSPAIDAGSDSVTNFLATDQRGFARLLGAHVDIGAVEGIYNPGPGTLIDATQLGDGTFQFGFTSYSGMSFTVFASTNVALPFNTWSNLGPAVETPASSGQFQFTDPQATNYPTRYYRVSSP